MTFAAKISATAGVAERQDAGRSDTPAEDRYVEQSGPPRVSDPNLETTFLVGSCGPEAGSLRACPALTIK
jgi:hypothetical protein